MGDGRGLARREYPSAYEDLRFAGLRRFDPFHVLDDIAAEAGHISDPGVRPDPQSVVDDAAHVFALSNLALRFSTPYPGLGRGLLPRINFPVCGVFRVGLALH